MKLKEIRKKLIIDRNSILYLTNDNKLLNVFCNEKKQLPQIILDLEAECITKNITEKEYKQYSEFEIVYSGVTSCSKDPQLLIVLCS